MSLLLTIAAPLALNGQSVAVADVRLRPGDEVRLEVRDEPDLAGEYRVDESGRVLLPLVGLVSIAGRSFSEVRAEIDAAYARELHDQQVRVTPLMRIAVLGEVRQPGLYPVDPTMRMGDVLALAGGIGPDANQDRIELVREGQVIETLTRATLPAYALPFLSGDQVSVARRGWFSSNSSALLGAGLSIVAAVTTALILR